MDEDKATPVNDTADDDMTMPPLDDSAMAAQDPLVAAQAAQDAPPVLQHAPVAPIPPVSGIPQAADDVDLIEKEWVEKAKEIVDRTAGDPYAQAKQLGQVKAEYVRKRYGRDVKTGE